MKPLATLCALVAALWLAPALAASNDIAAKLNAVMETSGARMSGVVLVADHGRLVFEQAVGWRDLANQKPMTPQAIFELASLSKEFTAMAVMMLKEEGRLSFDDPVEKYIPGLPYPGITLRHLLTHTSGLPDYEKVMAEHWDKTKLAHNADILAAFAQYKPERHFAPGEKYEYSNAGYVVLASVVEAVAQQDFREFVRARIFRPLAMNDTDIRAPEEWERIDRFALGYVPDKAAGALVRASTLPEAAYGAYLGGRYGPGRVSSTAGDLLKWDRALYTEQLVHKATLAEAYQPMKLNDGTLSPYGLGWMLASDPNLGRIVHHTGHNPGYANHLIRMIDKDLTVIILTNNAFEPLAALSNALTEALGGKPSS